VEVILVVRERQFDEVENILDVSQLKLVLVNDSDDVQNLVLQHLVPTDGLSAGVGV
jgi:hypothetical protein